VKPPSTLEKKFLRLWQILSDGQPDPEREFRFHPSRMWRFDFAWPVYRVAVEIDGGMFVGHGHQRGRQFTGDCEKMRQATLMGWRVLKYTTVDLGENMTMMIEEIEALLKQGKCVDVEEQRTLFGN